MFYQNAPKVKEARKNAVAELEIVYEVLSESPKPYPDLGLGTSWSPETEEEKISILVALRQVITKIKNSVFIKPDSFLLLPGQIRVCINPYFAAQKAAKLEFPPKSKEELARIRIAKANKGKNNSMRDALKLAKCKPTAPKLPPKIPVATDESFEVTPDEEQAQASEYLDTLNTTEKPSGNSDEAE